MTFPQLILTFPRPIMTFRQLVLTFPQLILTFPQLILTFPQLILTFPQLILTRPTNFFLRTALVLFGDILGHFVLLFFSFFLLPMPMAIIAFFTTLFIVCIQFRDWQVEVTKANLVLVLFSHFFDFPSMLCVEIPRKHCECYPLW